MKTRMDQLINGRFEYDVPGLILSTEKIVLKIMPEEKLRGELGIFAEDRRKIKGMHIRHIDGFFWEKKNLQEKNYSALRNRCQKDKGLKSEDKIEGEIVLSTSIKENTGNLPFSIDKVTQVRTSQEPWGHWKSLFALAKEDFRGDISFCGKIISTHF